MTLRSATQTVYEHAKGLRPHPWPTRPDPDGSALGGDQLAPVFAETADTFARSLAHLHPEPLAAPPRNADTTDGCFAYAWVEQYSPYFAERARKRLADATAGRGIEKRPYDQMTAVYASIARLVAPVHLGMRLADPTSGVELLAFEPVVLIRKPLGGSKQPHCHPGREKCGCSLNALALVAHLCVDGERRCAAIGMRPLPAHIAIERAVPIALFSLLAELDRAALLLGHEGGWQLATTPIVCGLLPAGGPRGRGPRRQTDVELVVGSTWQVVCLIEARREARRWGPHPFALGIPMTGVSTPGPRRIAPSALSAIESGWPTQPEQLAAEVAAVESLVRSGESPPERAERWAHEVGAPDGPATAWQVAARLAGPRDHVAVALLGRQAHHHDRATVWVSHPDLCEAAVPAIDAVLASREVMEGPLANSPFDHWIQRGYRRHAAGDLILKGGASEDLRTGIGAAMMAGFLDYTLGDMALKEAPLNPNRLSGS